MPAENRGHIADACADQASCEWISWDNHRRTMQLATALGVAVRVMHRGRLHAFQRIVVWVRTVLYLSRTSSRVIIVPNPSLLLAATACMLKRIRRYTVIQDLHSYFYQTLVAPRGLHERLYARLSRYCLRRADLTIVTNEFLREAVDRLGARSVVLQDKIPDMVSAGSISLAGRRNIVFVCTYSDDEPIDVVLEAARIISEGIHIYVTGRLPSTADRWTVPQNVHLTGYLSDHEYGRLLSSADAVLALTTREHTLLCAAYESVALGKPLVISDTHALREYFTKGVIYTENNSRALATALNNIPHRLDTLRSEVVELKHELAEHWAVRFSRVQATVHALTRAGSA
jgi:glycosyltransferase involved in cell wall biosynthesis